jgi:hypothetical protein
MVFKSVGVELIDENVRKFAEHLWWQNPTNPYSLRLTSVGYEWFKIRASIKCYEIILPEGQRILPKQLLQLERTFTEPYYVKNYKTLAVFGEKDAIMLELHAGDLVSYLNNIS